VGSRASPQPNASVPASSAIAGNATIANHDGSPTGLRATLTTWFGADSRAEMVSSLLA
jgi:hypothetical protein